MNLRWILPLLLIAPAAPWTVVAAPRAVAQGDELVPRDVRNGLRSLTTDLSKLGSKDAVDRMLALLAHAGDDPEALAKLERTWRKNLERKPRGKASTVLRKLEAQVNSLVPLLSEETGERRNSLAQMILVLDSAEPTANELIGRLPHGDRWLFAHEIEWEAGERRVADLLQEARSLHVPVDTGASESPTLEAVYGAQGSRARAHGVTILGRMHAETLERILRQALRALALSNALVTDVLDVPSLGGEPTLLLMDTERAYSAALTEALANGGLSQEDHDRNIRDRMRSFTDKRGWRTTRWRPEADFQALILWVLIDATLGYDAQPCLEAGHLNWVCLEFLGTSMPIVAWQEPEDAGGAARTVSVGETPFQAEALWRSARRSSFGCRSWMVHRVLQGRAPRWSRSMLDHVGKISGEDLLKSTLVAALLQQTNELAGVLEETRGKTERVAAFEAGLGRSLPEFEEQWESWLLGRSSVAPGIAQGLRTPGDQGGEDEDARQRDFLRELNRLRGLAFKNEAAEFEQVALDQELSQGALAHARYLGANPKQKEAWPDAHEEYADRDGFTPAGSRAGLNGVIAFTVDPRDALAQWMGTFYHRLPLIDPGMFGVGLGQVEEVCVLDVGSLTLEPWRAHWVAWPPADMAEVPRSFTPELPNPVPGEEMSTWGYPITLQLARPGQEAVLEVSLRLFEGGRNGEPVDCWFIAPDEPYFEELAPDNAWCLIPKTKLAARTQYTVAAEVLIPAETRSWSFTTE